MSNPLTPEQHTQVFLLMLGGNRATPFCLRTFDDSKARKRKQLSGNLTGTLPECQETLKRRNSQGAGVFAVVNEGGHTDREITRVRGVFADADRAPVEPLLNALTPHFVVCSSPGRYHVYYRVDQDFPLAQFTAVQTAIARKFSTDPSVSNLSRVMRVPGFLHNKGEPFLVSVDSVKPKLPPYSLEAIVKGLGLQGLESHERQSAPTRDAAPGDEQVGPQAAYSLPQIERMLKFINPWCERDRWRNVVFALVDEHGEAARDLVVRWSRGDLWPETDQRERA